ncbi:MAG: FAD:protein FMN transferase [Candidatus Omnitrophota bacterium]
MTKCKSALIFLILSILITTSCADKGSLTQSRLIMDTVVTIQIGHQNRAIARKALGRAFDKIEQLASSLNRHNEKSEISLINQAGNKRPIAVSNETEAILRRAVSLSDLTQGAFDVTIQPLTSLWREYESKELMPPEREIRKALRKVGYKNIDIRQAGRIRLRKRGMKLDLSAIAKGYIVDQAVATLRDYGIESGLVDAGGDIYCFGSSEEKDDWKIGVKHPRNEFLLGSIRLSEKAIATSGDYERNFKINGKKYSHILDPRTGYPASHQAISVTVIADDCMTADGLATAISVIGLREGMDLVERLSGIEAVIITESANGSIAVAISSGLEEKYEAI